MASHRAANQGYVYGTAARNMAAERERTRKQRVVQYRQDMSHTVRKNQEKALQMNLPYVIMLTLAAVCALYICIGYLHVQSSMTAKIHNIETLEQQLEQLRSENDALQTRINTDMDLDHIYKVATEELGMVYANRNQVLLYDKTESEYVRQYGFPGVYLPGGCAAGYAYGPAEYPDGSRYCEYLQRDGTLPDHP